MTPERAVFAASIFCRDIGQPESTVARVFVPGAVRPKYSDHGRSNEWDVIFEDEVTIRLDDDGVITSSKLGSTRRDQMRLLHPREAGVLLTRAQAIKRAIQVLTAAGLKETLCFNTVSPPQNDSHIELGSAQCFISFDRVVDGVKYDKQCVVIILDADTGLLDGHGINFTTRPLANAVPKFSKTQAIQTAKHQLAVAKIRSYKPDSAELSVVVKNTYWVNKNEDPVGDDPELAWICNFYTENRYYIVWVSAMRNVVIGGGEAGRYPPDEPPKGYMDTFIKENPDFGKMIEIPQETRSKTNDLDKIFIDFTVERLKKMTRAQRGAAIDHLGIEGFYIDAPEYWDAFDDPGVLLHACDILEEPYSDHFLNALENKLSKFPEPYPDTYANDDERESKYKFRGDGIRAAAILYRYGRSSGRKYLVDQLARNLNLDAAIILALNQDPHGIEGIEHILAPDVAGKAFLNPKSASRDSTWLLYSSLKDWGDERFKTAMFAKWKDYKWATPVAATLAAWGNKDVLPPSEQQFSHAGGDLIWRLYAAAVLVNAGNTDLKRDALKLLRDTLQNSETQKEPEHYDYHTIYRDPSYTAAMTIDICDALQFTELSPELRSLMDRYDSKSVVPLPDYFENSGDIKFNALQLAVKAAEALTRMHNTASVDSIGGLLEKTKAYNVDMLSRARVARAYLSLGGSGQVVKKIMGPAWLAKEAKISHLRKLPIYLLPKERFNLYLEE